MPVTEIVPISKVVVDKGFNNRRQLGDLTELAASIKSVGLLQPILVRRENGSFHLIAGERRLAASKLAGKKDIEIKVVDQDEKTRLESLLVENLHRKDIDPLEEADGYQRLKDLGLKQDEIAKKVGRSEAHISKRLALIGLSPTAGKLLAAGTIPIDAAVSLAKHPVIYQDRAIERLKKNFRDITDLAPYHLKRLGDDARDEAKKDARAKKRADLKKKLREDGVALLSTKDQYSWGTPGHPWRVGGKKSQYERGDRVDMTPSEHAKHPCHAATVTSPGSIYDTAEPVVVYLCTNPKAHMTVAQAAALERKVKDSQHDSWEEKRRRADAVRKEVREAQASRAVAIREALRSTDQQALATLALESFVMTADFKQVAELLGLPAGQSSKEKSLVDYCNASHANLIRAGAAVAVLIGQGAIAHAAETQAGGYFHNGNLGQAIAVAAWLDLVKIPLVDLERKVVEKAKKK